MTAIIRGTNVSLAWLAALEYLLEHEGSELNLMVEIGSPGEEDSGVRGVLDEFLAEHGARRGVLTVSTVANTIFPEALYRPKLGARARLALFSNYREGLDFASRHRIPSFGPYFRRLVAWPGRNGEVNQLERVIARLRSQLARSNPLGNTYELAVSEPEDLPAEPCLPTGGGTADLRIYLPGQDNGVMGFPCLSHISLKLHRRQLYLTAVYRNQHFVRKAYGNYLGLGRLLDFLCREVDCEPGELACLATHADAELGEFGKRRLKALCGRCQQATGVARGSSLVAADRNGG